MISDLVVEIMASKMLVLRSRLLPVNAELVIAVPFDVTEDDDGEWLRVEVSVTGGGGFELLLNALSFDMERRREVMGELFVGQLPEEANARGGTKVFNETSMCVSVK